ncbi:MAG TPA: chemotaxis protein CheB [Terriglobales bacterium]
MPSTDVVVIGASAGGIEALQQLCAGLPANLPAAILVVMHVSPYSDALLPRLLNRVGPLPAVHPKDGETIRKGKIYIAPPDLHMVVEDGHVRLVHGPRENHNRPAIDPTFRSAAMARGNHVIGVVLTGLLDDGTAGLTVIRAHGGDAVVQDPETAMFPSMPKNALQRVPDAHVSSLAEMPSLLSRLLSEKRGSETTSHQIPDEVTKAQVRSSELDMSELQNENRPGIPSEFGCPECGGVLWEHDENGMWQFRCRVGHAYTARHLKVEQRQAVEAALWSALRALEESVSLYRRMADRARSSNHTETTKKFEERVATQEENAKVLREFLLHLGQNEDEEAS